MDGLASLAEVTRGGIVESRHLGAVAVVSADGQLVASAGDPGLVTFMRSSSKPLQALPVIESGAADHFELTQQQLAIICGSHGGETTHVDTVVSILTAAGYDGGALLCGVHAPHSKAGVAQLQHENGSATTLHHNCSGKHSGMLLLARHMGQNLTTPYTDPQHPIQQLILNVVAAMAGIPAAQIVVGIDGCSVPNFAMPLQAAARAMARMVDSDELPEPRAMAAHRLVAAMRAYPAMVRHEGGFDTRVMQAIPGLVSKVGAEAYWAAALPAGLAGDGSPALGIAAKIIDGGERARSAVALAVLAQLGVAIPAELDDLRQRTLSNWAGLTVGEVRASVALQTA